MYVLALTACDNKKAEKQADTRPIVGMQSFTFLKDKSLAEGLWYVDVAMADKDFLRRYKNLTGDDVTNFAENFYTLLLVIYEQRVVCVIPKNMVFSAQIFISA